MTEPKRDSGKPGGRAQEIAGEPEEQPEKERGSKAQGHVLSWDKMCFLFFFVLCLFLGLAFMFSLWIISNMRKNRGNTLINHPYTHPLASMIICQPRETCF